MLVFVLFALLIQVAGAVELNDGQAMAVWPAGNCRCISTLGPAHHKL
jgi:hypothetical protein